MKLVVRHSGISFTKGLDSIVRREIGALEPLRQIDQAMVHLTRDDEASPPFRVNVHLFTPGPDVFAEARDHTLAAALSKVMKQLAHEIKARAGKRLARMKSNLQAPAPTRLAPSHG
jgi:ribosome-associated translation inhibitor RaiA